MQKAISSKYRFEGVVKEKSRSGIDSVCIFAFLIRLVVLIAMLLMKEEVDPYFIKDDIKFEELARMYMNMASSPIDTGTFEKIGASGYLTTFWPWVVCISAYIFRTEYASRFINIILSTLCVRVIYLLTEQISKNERTALKSAKLFAFLPVTILTSCFCIKDIFLTFAVSYLFYLFVKYSNKARISLLELVFATVLSVAIYNTRGAVIELMLIFLFAFIFKRLWTRRRYFALFMWCIIGALVLYFGMDYIVEAFSTKMEDYSGYKDLGDGIQMVKINSIWDIYKLPFAYFFATIQPARFQYFTGSTSRVWYALLCYSNISIFPVAIGNFMYMFHKKKNLLFWLTSFIMYSAIISISIGIFRHYLFLIPLEMINYSLYTEQKSRNKTFIIAGGSMALFLVIAFNTVRVML